MSDVDRRILDVVTVTRALAYHNIIKGKYFMKFVAAEGFRLEDIGRMDDIGDIGVFIRYRCIIGWVISRNLYDFVRKSAQK